MKISTSPYPKLLSCMARAWMLKTVMNRTRNAANADCLKSTRVGTSYIVLLLLFCGQYSGAATLYQAASIQSPQIIVEKNCKLNLYQAAAAIFWPSR